MQRGGRATDRGGADRVLTQRQSVRRDEQPGRHRAPGRGDEHGGGAIPPVQCDHQDGGGKAGGRRRGGRAGVEAEQYDRPHGDRGRDEAQVRGTHPPDRVVDDVAATGHTRTSSRS